MKTSRPGKVTLQALQCLRDSGSKSFERLTANLFSELIDFPIRLCKSSEQGGIDALAEIPIAIENKRYGQKKLDAVELDGKTWCVFDWLQERLSNLSLPVFLIGSNQGIRNEKTLEDHILDDIRRVLSPAFGRHTEALVQRQRTMELGSTPWCLVVLDGLNEYQPSVDKCRDYIAWAIGRLDLARRPCAVLVTVREQSWLELNTQVPGQKREIQIGPYDDREFRDALRLEGLSEDYLTTILDSARLLIRRPRYLGLVTKHKDKLGAYSVVTPDVLQWLDACDKIARSESAPGLKLDAKGYQEALKNLATRYRESGFLNRTVVLDAIGKLAANLRAALSDLELEEPIE